MSGGHFDYKQFWIREISDTIERDIARALQPKPAMVHEDYWVIDKMDSPGSYYIYPRYMEFESYEDVEAYLMHREEVVRAEAKYTECFLRTMLLSNRK